MTAGSEDRYNDPVDGAVEAIVSHLGLHPAVEIEATIDDHAADVAGLIVDAAAHRARFEDTLDAS